jgi:hypothetical protein
VLPTPIVGTDLRRSVRAGEGRLRLVNVCLPRWVSLVLLCSACGFWPPIPSCDPEVLPCGEVYVRVSGPADGPAPEDYVLEIGESGWPIQKRGGGGITSVEVAPEERVMVRLVEPRRCEAVVEFAASPGSYWVIRLAADGTPTVEDWTGGEVELGPALGQGRRSNCVFDS